ncbi:MAG: antibiotic biosynthesis monooxygenase [Deltaproteobacteria bacterium]|nr:antibiotic biosynthesis monooxygenase [Deltaproteobacteria bacterium]
MAVKIIIKRIVPQNKAEALKPLLQKLRNLAMQQPGYKSMDNWREWVLSDERRGTQEKIDHLLGEKTDYEIYMYD